MSQIKKKWCDPSSEGSSKKGKEEGAEIHIWVSAFYLRWFSDP